MRNKLKKEITMDGRAEAEVSGDDVLTRVQTGVKSKLSYCYPVLFSIFVTKSHLQNKRTNHRVQVQR